MSGLMSKVLVDTNVWIDFFRGERASPEGQHVAEVLDTLLVHDRVLTCGIIETELYQGVRDDERAILEAQLEGLDFLETTRGDYRTAGTILNRLRKRGITIPTPDALIAALCLRDDLVLLERDSHFAEIEGLKRYPWRNSGTP